MPTLHHHRSIGQPQATLPPLQITTASIPAGSIGNPYSASLSATGGLGPYTWSTLSKVPNTGNWLTLSSAGVFTGTPGTPETEVVLVQVIDSQGTKASKFFTLSVTGTPLSITTTSPLPGATVGSAYSVTMAATGGISPYVWTVLSDTPNTGNWFSMTAGGLGTGTPTTAETESLVIQVQDSVGTIVSAPFSITVSAAVSTVLSFPRVMLVGVAGDQSYGSNSGTGYPNWLTAGAGTAANIAVQTIGSYDVAIIQGVFEGWDTGGLRDRENLTQALLKNASYSITKNTSRQTLTFYYEMMCTTISGNPYAQWQTLVDANNWYLYESAGGVGTKTPFPFGTGQLHINYCAAWPGAIGSAGIGASICGTNYGTTSTGSPTGVQGPARSFGNYAAIKLLMRGYTGDSRYSFNAQMGSPSAAGIFLDNAFVALDGAGSVPNSYLDGINVAPGSQQGGGFPNLDTVQPVMARGIHNMFDQMQTMLTLVNPGRTYYNFANYGQYANKYQFGTAPLTSGLENTLHGGLLENAIGAGASSWEQFQTGNTNTGNTLWPSGWPNLLANYYQGMDFCLAPKLVGLGIKLPSTDGTQTASWPVGAGTTAVTVTTGTAFEYQLMRYGLCTILLDDGYFAPGVGGYNWAIVRWYDEYGDDSLAQVNFRRGYLGTPLTTRPTTPYWNVGPMGVWMRQFTNGIAVINPRGNGAQTITLPRQYQALIGTQQPLINNGGLVSTFTIPDGDGRIFVLPYTSFSLVSLIPGTANGGLVSDSNTGLAFADDAGGNFGTWDSANGLGVLNWAAGGTAGFRWTGIDQVASKGGVYIKYDLIRTQNQDSKELKLFGNGYPSIYSNFTMGCNAGGYSGTRMGLSYSDSVSGGDINTQFFLDAAPTLTGGSSYSRTPHPTINNHVGGNEAINGTVNSLEWYVRHNTDAGPDGEMACWLNGTLIFWAVSVFNCRTGGQGFNRIDIGGYAPTPGTVEKYNKVYINVGASARPVGRGI
jgi:hypothetical protein